ncbi:GtrA family protein [Halorhabdus amylolytica]|uniref:GtrA family protein n=1 Tax=Halorhabdus amylolytica TaxID=2559573 RepID=UPI0010AAA50E|nr:GtrA family protein [Halorhabdus amylolytica]
MSDADEWLDGRLESLLSGVRFGKFVSVGVIGAISDNAVLAVLGLVFAVPEMWAKAAGIETAILVMFAVNERWTFATEGSSGTRAVLRRLGRSHLVRSGGVTVQLIVYWLLTQQLTVTLYVFGTDLWFLAASPIAIAIAMVVNYVFESLFTWRVHLENESARHGKN